MEYSPEELDLVNQYGKTAEGSDLKKRIDDLASRRSSDPSNWFSYQDQIKSLNDQYKQGYTKYIEDYKSQQSSPPASPTPGGGDSELNEYGDLLDSLKDSKKDMNDAAVTASPSETKAPVPTRVQALRNRLSSIRERANVQKQTNSLSRQQARREERQQQVRAQARNDEKDARRRERAQQNSQSARARINELRQRLAAARQR